MLLLLSTKKHLWFPLDELNTHPKRWIGNWIYRFFFFFLQSTCTHRCLCFICWYKSYLCPKKCTQCIFINLLSGLLLLISCSWYLILLNWLVYATAPLGFPDCLCSVEVNGLYWFSGYFCIRMMLLCATDVALSEYSIKTLEDALQC